MNRSVCCPFKKKLDYLYTMQTEFLYTTSQKFQRQAKRKKKTKTRKH